AHQNASGPLLIHSSGLADSHFDPTPFLQQHQQQQQQQQQQQFNSPSPLHPFDAPSPGAAYTEEGYGVDQNADPASGPAPDWSSFLVDPTFGDMTEGGGVDEMLPPDVMENGWAIQQQLQQEQQRVQFSAQRQAQGTSVSQPPPTIVTPQQ